MSLPPSFTTSNGSLKKPPPPKPPPPRTIVLGKEKTQKLFGLKKSNLKIKVISAEKNNIIYLGNVKKIAKKVDVPEEEI